MKRLFLILSIISVLLLSGCFFLMDDASNSEIGKIGIGNLEQSIDYSDYEEIEDLLELRDFVIEQIEDDNLEFSFVYSGEEDLDPGVIAQMGGVCFVKYVQEGKLYTVSVTEFPGARIVDAFFKDDTSKLNEDECLALEKAVEMVDEAQAISEDDWELELAIHDILAQHITYSHAPIDYDDPEDQPRHLSVVGALLDGSANCQGYTDAFYTLASIAGFEVGRLSVETPSEPHMVNTICLNDKWYVVDVTYDDSNDKMVNYHLFNVGMDFIGEEFYWPEEIETHSIVRKSDELNYYIRNDLVFDDMEDLAGFVAKQYAKNDKTVIHAMLLDEDDSEELNEALQLALEDYRISYEYSLWYSDNGEDSFYTVIFKE